MLLKVPVLELETPTRQHHIYTKETAELMIKQFKELETSMFVFYEPNLEDTILQDMTHASAVIKDMYIENKNVYADIELLDTEYGRLISKLFELGTKLHFYIMGIGNIGFNGTVCSDFRLTCFGVEPYHETQSRAQPVQAKLDELGIHVDYRDYNFLNTTPELNNLILLGLGGSYAYGTNVETSDVDIRGIALHSPEDILLGKGFEQVINEPTDTTIYSLKKIVSLLTNCNPNTIEMLGLKPEHYLYLSDIGKELLKNKDMFLSNRCIGSFMGYANSQMYRLQQKALVALTEEQLNAHIVKTIQGMRHMLEQQHNMNGIDVRLENGEIVFDFNIKSYPAESLAGVLGSINTTLRDYRKNSQRNEKAMAHGKIAKHSMHLLRLYMMCEDMLLRGEINTYREKEHDLLMDIRNGKYLGSDGRPNKEFFELVHDYESRLDYAKEHSVLPDKPDMKRIEKFMMDVNTKQIMKRIL